MKQIESLWPKRLHAFFGEIRRYAKYMLNDHIKFVLIFGTGGALYYYSQWINKIGPDFPGAAIAAAILAGLLSASPVMTLVKAADAVFLSPLEKRLYGYFQKAGRLSFILQSYLLLLVLASLMPMLHQTNGAGFKSFFLIFACLLLLKIWNLRMHWNALKWGRQSRLLGDFAIRFALNGLFLYVLIQQASVFMVVAAVFFIIAYTLYFENAAKQRMLKWETLIEKEEGRMQLFYRTANMFTDVPHVKSRARRRKWLDPVFKMIPYGQNKVYTHLFSRTIARTKEYSGLIIRLTVIPAILLVFVENPFVIIAVALFFSYLTGFQLLPLYSRHNAMVWVHLYPVSHEVKKRAFVNLLFYILAGQAVLFILILLLKGSFLNAVYAGAAGLVFAAWFSGQYAPKRIGNANE